jgi:lipopolysaccharide/colanic/teichoic acid biosynthesis glycosyltransferase
MTGWLLTQRVIAAGLTVLAIPVLLPLAIAIKLDSTGPAFFRSERVGQGGRPIHILKLRTMHQSGHESGPAVTVSDDQRVTRIGRWIRAHRLDELPQLWDVACGRMALVGPRPEAPRFVSIDDPVWLEILSVRPGITGPSQLRFHDEGLLLSDDAEATYRAHVLPTKMSSDLAYVRSRSVKEDVRLLRDTVRFFLGRR